jgi:hypothetical protein
MNLGTSVSIAIFICIVLSYGILFLFKKLMSSDLYHSLMMKLTLVSMMFYVSLILLATFFMVVK